ncbi:MAG: hypothetical protein K0S99_3726, partial [Thermomicrobiales bacterium]|nr:hypothetical protein [Thermomicrobiales bacterium]
MRTTMHTLTILALMLLMLPLSALAQEATPETLTFDL